ncbi:MAG TPA: hypothetical protein VGG19_09530 [Tepidisphaeraceae bacterium]|jgi:hypothetical protein
MVKKAILSLSVMGMTALMAANASAQIQAGNVWPNPDLSVAAPAGVDQVYSYYNGTYSSGGTYVPNATGDTNPRPDGWHRGGVDFGTLTTPEMLFYTPAEGSTLNPSPSGYSLEIDDNDPNNYGEWFSDWNALPAGSTAGSQINLQFFWEYTNLASTNRNGDDFRVSVDWGDSVGDDTMTAPNQIGSSVDDNLSIPGTVDETAWTQVDELLTIPAGAQSMRITIDSGGSSQATGQIWVDDISVAVPEPASLGLGAAVGLTLMRRRRS